MKIHREGYSTLLVVTVSLILINTGIILFTEIQMWLALLIIGVSMIVFLYFLQFFRNPDRSIVLRPGSLLAAADGELVAVEETLETEYFNEKRLQVSIFMSPYNIHSNRSPVSGEITYIKYHPGKFLVAWHPKSSILNERLTLVIKGDDGIEILVRQIAGAVARRIVTYPKVGDRVTQGEEIGFIKFGSRVDMLVPVHTEIDMELGAKVKGGLTCVSSSIEAKDKN